MSQQSSPTDRPCVGEIVRNDLETIEDECTTFIQNVVDEANADGVVIALSGGIDSATSATLAVEALGAESVFALVLPSGASSDTNMADAKRVVWNLGIDYRCIDLKPTLTSSATS